MFSDSESFSLDHCVILYASYFNISGKNCDTDVKDCPGSCNSTYTARTLDKTGYCECVCKEGYTGKNCSVSFIFVEYQLV